MWYDKYFRDWETFQLPEDSKELQDCKDEILADGHQYETKLFKTDCGEEYIALRTTN